MHVNRSYVFQGGSVDPKQFFRMRNLNRKIAKLEDKLTAQLLAELSTVFMPAAPEIAPGRHCTDPVTCEFYDCCNQPRPADHIGYLPRIHASTVEELGDMGVESIRNIPDDFEL